MFLVSPLELQGGDCMNGLEIFGMLRQQVADAVAAHTAPNLTPLPISPWVAMSALQKSIRRGDEEIALRAAATLIQQSPDRLWRRLGVGAFEDIGVADLETAFLVI